MENNKIASFEEFKKRATNVTEDNLGMSYEGDGHGEHSHDEPQYYMFFQNLASIKHHIEEISKMNPDQIDALLKDGHDWASDHIATSKDDIQEVAEWLRNETEGIHEEPAEEEEIETSVVIETPEGGEESEDDDDDDDDEEEESEEEESEENEG